MHVTILTIFPEMFPGPLAHSLAGNALKKGIWSMDIINIRDFGMTKHKNVDDTPYGGGNGLVMRPDVLSSALDKALETNPDAKIYYPSPRGIVLDQKKVKEISKEKNIIILCGRYEGVDERVLNGYNAEHISVGNFVLSGGEVAALVMLDASIRLISGVLKNPETLSEESFECNIDGLDLIECPQYTKPKLWNNKAVPEILLSGDHGAIEKWRQGESVRVTKERNEKIRKNN